MRFSQLLVEVKLFALGFLSPHEVDTLQLVDSNLNSLIERHRRRHLPRHEVDINYEASFSLPLSIAARNPPGSHPDANLIRLFDGAVLLDDREAIATRLDSSRVGSVYRLTVIGDMPYMGERVLAARLQSERIPVKAVEVREVERPRPAYLHISLYHNGPRTSRLNWGCVEEFRLTSSPSQHTTLGHTIPHLIYHPHRWSTHTMSEILFQQFTPKPVFEGRAVICLPHSWHDYAADFVTYLKECFMTETSTDFPKDILLIHIDPYGGVGQQTVTSGPVVWGVRMEDGWWRDPAEGDSPLHAYYSLLDGCGYEWAVWRVWSPQIVGRHLRVMQKNSDVRVNDAVHIQVVNDDDAKEGVSWWKSYGDDW